MSCSQHWLCPQKESASHSKGTAREGEVCQLLSPCYQMLQQEVLATGPCCPKQGYPTRVARSKAHRNQQLQQCRLNSGEVDGSGLKLAHAPPGLLPESGAEPFLCGHANAHSGCSRKAVDPQSHVSSDCYGPRGSPATPTRELVSYSCGALDSLELWQRGKKPPGVERLLLHRFKWQLKKATGQARHCAWFSLSNGTLGVLLHNPEIKHFHAWAWLWGPPPPLQKGTFDLFCVLRSTNRNSFEKYLLWWFKKTQKDMRSCVGGVWKQLSRSDLPIQPCVCHELTPQTSPAVRGNGISFTQQGLGSFSLWGTFSLISCGFGGKCPPCALRNHPCLPAELHRPPAS